ncbi:adaptor protein MecA [Sporolactobacillus sp. Y61]|uniref:Adapter protein MecA n=1 Tax=Sporolactobacillus sp. Y61 TaxID=3160863 RepID=A0AAU8ICS3_9BACL
MKIERINENTLKFYISYLDIEDRGFDREEIWYNRERSEELFWQMMDEAHSQESFSLEGPLWIQVQALEKGMEIIVTRAQIMKKGLTPQLPEPAGNNHEKDQTEKLDQLTDKHSAARQENIPVNGEGKEHLSEDDSEDLSFVFNFKEFEDMISLSHAFKPHPETEMDLYVYQGKYFLNVTFSDQLPEEEQDDDLSRILEYGLESNLTTAMLEEYGKKLISQSALQVIKKHFPLLK